MDRTDSALPYPWPTSSFNRTRIPWWIAAQLLRTTRQRARIDELAAAAGISPTGGLADANPHLEYMSEMTPLVALQLQNRPWSVVRLRTIMTNPSRTLTIPNEALQPVSPIS